jgi:hypothetical protein
VVIGWVAAPRGRFEVVPVVLSIPGYFLAIAIWGFNAGESALSYALIVAINTFVYSMVEILLFRFGQAVGRHFSKQTTGA